MFDTIVDDFYGEEPDTTWIRYMGMVVLIAVLMALTLILFIAIRKRFERRL